MAEMTTNPSNFLILSALYRLRTSVNVVLLPFSEQEANMFKLVVILCLVASLNAATFDYKFARDKMFPLAAAAYAEDPSDCLWNLYNERISGYFFHQDACDSKDNTCFGFIGALNKQKAIVISFRGTDSTSQLMQEVVNRKKMNVWFLGPGHVSKYFYDAFLSVWNGLRHAFDEQHKFHPDYEIWVTGHSLGGAMASLAAHYIKRKYDIPANQIKLVTFGQPRTGDDEYSKLFNAEMDYAFRIVNERDAVPHIPFGNSYTHHKYEVWFPNGMEPDSKYEVCLDEAESNKKCSNSLRLPISGWINHRHYFGKLVSDYGKQGCPV